MNENASPSDSVPASRRGASATVEPGRTSCPARRPPQYAGDRRKTVQEGSALTPTILRDVMGMAFKPAAFTDPLRAARLP